MRTITNINHKWAFTKQTTQIPEAIDKTWDFVNLPHSWNAIDGQDGGGDYFRGTAIYAKELIKEELPEAKSDYSRCVSCGTCRDCRMCLNSCPEKAISRVETGEGKGFAYVSDPERCIGCGVCAGVCPCGIWTMHANEEKLSPAV